MVITVHVEPFIVQPTIFRRVLWPKFVVTQMSVRGTVLVCYCIPRQRYQAYEITSSFGISRGTSHLWILLVQHSLVFPARKAC